MMSVSLKNIRWRNVFLLAGLLIFEVAIHPLDIGPDRRIHDPAVYRLEDENYLPGDWYTQMAVDSRVYTFYAPLVNFGPFLGIPEELWRQFLYLVCLVVLYWSLIKIAGLFSRSPLVVPLVALFHAVLVIVVPPIWLYGPFIQVDGGLAPRSVGIAFSFLALYFLLNQARFLPWLLLGVATLIHVSNSLVTFVLFLAASLVSLWFHMKVADKVQWKKLFQEAINALVFYLLAGGWFALWIAFQASTFVPSLSSEKFIWTWVYFRAPYMALPLVRWEAWAIFGMHIITLFACWYLLRQYFFREKRFSIDLLGFVGSGALLLFFFFYIVTFVFPWLPGFQFYSLRVIYFLHFISYLFAALTVVSGMFFLKERMRIHLFPLILFFAVIILGWSATSSGQYFFKRSYLNLYYTSVRLKDLHNPIGPPSSEEAVGRYIFLHPEPFLAPPDWYGSPAYLPHMASFKTFGFTLKGLEEWYERINDVTGGELEKRYQAQKKSGVFAPVSFQWGEVYPRLTEEQVKNLAKKYHFRLFVTYREEIYSFPVLTEDNRYRLYQVTP